MIVNKKEMLRIEADTQKDEIELVSIVSNALKEKILPLIDKDDLFIFLIGKGNNGADGLALFNLIKEKINARLYLVEGTVKTKAAKYYLDKIEEKYFVSKEEFDELFQRVFGFIDCVYGFSFHGNLKEEISELFSKINSSNKKVYSIDINSGANSDSSLHDKDALRSDITFCLDAYKPFHMLRKEHLLFKETVLVELGFPHLFVAHYVEMNEEIFLNNFKKRDIDSYKGKEGKVGIIAGSLGMAGALMLNIIGARSLGASYINVGLDKDIYEMVASKQITCVYHPFDENNYLEVLNRLVNSSSAVAYGSGINNLKQKREILDYLLTIDKPLLLDAEALRLLYSEDLSSRKQITILTPHYGELSNMLNMSVNEIKENEEQILSDFVKKYNVILLIKGPHSKVFYKDEVYINQSGNEALSVAGSGDLLSGIIISLLAKIKDPFLAVTMAVFIHGHLADYGLNKYSKINFLIEDYYEIANDYFKNHGY